MNSLFRFISFPSFVNIMEFKKERYVAPFKWEDTYEGYLLRLLDNENDKEEIFRELLSCSSFGNPEDAVRNYLRLWCARWLCYGQCWTTLEESDAFWRIYSYNNMAVRIETDETAIQNLFLNDEMIKRFEYRIDNVQYDLDQSLHDKTRKDLFRNIFDKKITTESYYHKRTAFEHEHEKRIILLDKELANVSVFPEWCTINNLRIENGKKKMTLDESILFAMKELDRHSKLLKSIKSIHSEGEIAIKIPNIKEYIKGVMVHPHADEWIVKLVEEICLRENLKFSGKSQLYEIV